MVMTRSSAAIAAAVCGEVDEVRARCRVTFRLASFSSSPARGPTCRLTNDTPGAAKAVARSSSGIERRMSLTCSGLPAHTMPTLKPPSLANARATARVAFSSRAQIGHVAGMVSSRVPNIRGKLNSAHSQSAITAGVPRSPSTSIPGRLWRSSAGQALLHAEGHRRAARCQQRHIARELDGVAETLLGVNVDAPARQALALPRTLRMIGRPLTSVDFSRHSYSSQPSAMSPRISSRMPSPEWALAWSGVERDGASQRGDRFVVAARMMQRGAEIAPAVGEIRRELDGAAIASTASSKRLKRVQRIAEIAVRLREVRLGRDRLAMRLRRAFVILQLVERDTKIAERRRHRRFDLERAAGLLGGLLGLAGKPQHLAEIGVVERHLRRDLGRAPHMLDRLADLAVLVRDDAEQMDRFGQVRLRLQNFAAKPLGFQGPALAAIAFGQRSASARGMNCCP